MTQTINRVVERTIEVVSPPQKPVPPTIQTIVVKEEEFITKAAERNAQNILEVGYLKKRFRVGGIGRPPVEEFELELLGTAFAINGKFAVTDTKVLDGKREDLVIRTIDKHFYKVAVALEDAPNNLSLLSIDEHMTVGEGLSMNTVGTYTFDTASLASIEKVQIGQTALALGVEDGVLLSLGVISRIKTIDGELAEGETKAKKIVTAIYTTLTADSRYRGGPLININGEIIGINTTGSSNEHITVPVDAVKVLLSKQSLAKTE